MPSRAVLFLITLCSTSFTLTEGLKSCPQKCVNLGLCGCELSKVINAERELTQEQASQLAENVCGLDLNSISDFKVKVCCECQHVTPELTMDEMTKQPRLPRVSLLLKPNIKCTNFTHEHLDVLPVDCGISQPYEQLIKPRIISGNITNYYELPWMVQIVAINETEDTWKMFCGGTIISKRYILTAAHCIDFKNTMSYKVIVGLTDADEDLKKVDYDIGSFSEETFDHTIMDVSDHFIHPDYNSTTYKNDIALIRLREDIFFSRYAQPICLPVFDKYCTKLSKSKLVVSGWGVTEKGNLSAQLRHAEVPFMNFKNCKEIFKSSSMKLYRDVNICAGGESADICSGDSGGPLQAMFPRGELNHVAVQFGVISQGSENLCGKKGYPGVFTSVKYFLNWIINTIAQRD